MRRLLAVALLASLAVGGGLATADVGPFADPPPVRVTDDASGGVLWPFLNDSATTLDTTHVGAPSSSRPEPVGFVVENSGPRTSVPLTVVHRPTGESVVDRTITMDTETAIVIVFHRPSNYRVTVETERGVSEYPVERSDFDCNEKTMGVRIEDDGQTAYTSLSTSMGCPSLLGEAFEDALAVGSTQVLE